jgi:Putative Actinobacterial Holin-X, holin superfamily III
MPMSRFEPSSASSSQSVPGLLHQLTTQLSRLLRQELTLARTELYQSLTRLLSSAGVVAGGIAVLYAGFLLILAAAVFGLALLLPVWLAALSLGVVITAIGWGFVQRGRRLLRNAHLALSHLPNSLRRDKDVLLRRAGS